MSIITSTTVRFVAALLALAPAGSALVAQDPASSNPVAATGSLEGQVVMAGRDAPLGDVVVRLAGTARGSVTDADGRYRITGIPAGSYVVVTQRPGTQSKSIPVTVAAGINALDISLERAATVVAPVTVTATREMEKRSDASLTVDVLSGADIRATRAAHPSGIMNRIPGVHVSELSGEGHSMAMRQPITTKPMYLYLEDGVPTRATGFFNHNALYEVNIPQAGGLEVIKGPGTALYGSDAIGGVVNVLTRPAPATPTLEMSIEGGAYGYRRAMATGGRTFGTQGIRADLNVTHSDNWKQQAPFDRQSGTIRWDAAFNGWIARTVVAGSNIEQQDVPTITKAEFDTARTINKAPIAYRTVQALRASTTFERESGRSLWSFTPYARYNTLGLLPSWQLTFDPQTWDTRNTSVGMLARYRHDYEPMRARIIAGADVDYSPGSFKATQAVLNTVGTGTARRYPSYTDGAQQYDYDLTYRALSPYLHTEVSPLARLRIDAGVRYDVSGYEYHTRLAPLDTGAHRRPADTDVSYRHLSPKIGATYEWAEWLNTFASYRHGFRAPSQGQLFQQNSALNTVGLEPVKVDSYEFGIRGDIGSRVVYQLSAYDMIIRDDIITFITAQNTREATNAGRTRHRGIEGGAGIALLPTLHLDASWSVSKQRYITWDPQAARTGVSAVSYGGRNIEQAPRDLGSVLLAWSPTALKGGRVAAEWSHVGRYAEDPANTYYYGGYELVSLHTNARLMRRVEVFGRLTNVFDRPYAELVAWDAFQREQFTPGAPRTLYAGLKYGFSK